MKADEKILFPKERDIADTYHGLISFVRQEFKSYFIKLLKLILPLKIGILSYYFLTFKDYIYYSYTSHFVGYYHRIEGWPYLFLAEIFFLIMVFTVMFAYIQRYMNATGDDNFIKSVFVQFWRILPIAVIIILLSYLYNFYSIYIFKYLLYPYVVKYSAYHRLLKNLTGLFLFIPLIFSFFLVADKKATLYSSVRNTFKFARSRWLVSFIVFVLLICLQIIVITIFGIIYYGFLVSVFGGHQVEISTFVRVLGISLIFLSYFINELIICFFYSIFSLFFAFQYYSLSERKKTADAMVNVENTKKIDIDPVPGNILPNDNKDNEHEEEADNPDE